MQPQDSIARAIVKQRKLNISKKEALLVEFIDKTGNISLNWQDIAAELCESSSFRDLWNRTWADIPFDFQWKPVPIHPTTATTKPFFTVVVPASFRRANPSAYREYLQKLGAKDLITDFVNLSGDAHLIIPQATGEYGHIAAFCRDAAADMQQALWAKVGELATEAIDRGDSVWCNTHGHGVPWMHVRFDRYLKYTAFPPSGSIDAASQKFWYENIYC